MNNIDIITLLNKILEDLYDSRDGYKEGADQVNNHLFKNYFSKLAEVRQEMINILEQEIIALNGRITTEGSLLAKAHRIYLDLKSVLAKGDHAAITSEIKRGENVLINNYENAVASVDLPERIKLLLSNQLIEIKANLLEIDALLQHPQ